MSYDPNVLRRATARLEERRHLQEKQQEALRQQVYAKEPRLAQLDRLLQSTMTELALASLRRGEDVGETVQTIRAKNL